MQINGNPGTNVTRSAGEHECMAATLEAQHGIHAAEVADFFCDAHQNQGNAVRAWAWAGVAKLVRRRAAERTGQDIQPRAPRAS